MLVLVGFVCLLVVVDAQFSIDLRNLETVQAVPAVSGHEEKLTAIVTERLKALSRKGPRPCLATEGLSNSSRRQPEAIRAPPPRACPCPL
jgi:hypothetical protein